MFRVSMVIRSGRRYAPAMPGGYPSAMDARRSRRLVEVAVVAVAALLVAGVIVGVMVGRPAAGPDTADLSDGLFWVRDEAAGEAVQVNPATGRREDAVAVAPPGESWQLAQ